MSGLDLSLLRGRTLCAVSGGADSVYLLRRCVEAGLDICAAHLNHCLRDEESDRDERFVLSLCDELGVSCSVGRADVAAYARENGLGIEEAAREVRYDFLEKTADALGCATIATAHNADDNAETMLLALVRGSGTLGLAGIPERRGRIVRPMLGVTRAEIERWLSERGYAHVEDSTNASTDYTRNRIRALVMPVLREINPELAAAASRASALLRDDEEHLSAQAADFLALYPSGRVDCAALAALHRSVASRVVRLMSPAALSYVHVASVLAAVEKLNAAADVPGGRFLAERGYLRFVPAGAAKVLPERAVSVPGVTELPEAGLRVEAELSGNVCEIHTSLNTFCFKYENICGNISCTPPRPGDRIRLAGRGCTKKLADLFAERDIPASERALVPVLRDGEKVLALPGFGQAEGALPEPGDAALVIRVRRI